MRLTIGRKLGAGFGLMIALVVCLAAVVYVNAGSVSRQTNATFEENVPAVELGLTLQSEIHHALSIHRGYMILGLDSLAQERLDTWKAIDVAMASMNTHAAGWDDPALRRTWERCAATMAELRVAQDQIAAVSHTGSDHPADTLFYDDAAPFGEAMVDNLQAILDIEDTLEATPERKELVRRVAAAEGHLLKSRYAIAAFLVSGEQADADTVTGCIDACQASVDSLMTMTHLFNADQTVSFDAYINARAQFLGLAKQAIAVRTEPGYCVSESICLNTVTPLAAESNELIAQIVAAQSEAKAEAIAGTQAASATMVKTVLWTTGGAVFMAVCVAMFLSRQITGGLRKIIAFTQEIANKNLSIEPLSIHTNDEFETLGNTVNTMHQSIRGVIGDVNAAAQEVAGASTQISASNEEIACGVDNQSRQVEQISAAIAQMTASIREVADQSESASGNAESSTELATQGGTVVQETIAGMNSINDAVTGSAASVSELGKRSEQIGQIINVINDIADQTNLLALNAAIEAARAGEHGRGFAVVADEVRKLAERTQEATEEVSQSVMAIQTETSVAVERMKKGTEEVARGVELAGSAGQSLSSIVTGTQQVTAMIREIAAAAEEQTKAADDVSRGISEIGQSAQSASRGTQEASIASNQLSAKAEELRAMVGQFRL